jgi:hypothetical protein
MNPRVRLPLFLLLTLGVVIVFIPRSPHSTPPPQRAIQAPAVMRYDGVWGNVKTAQPPAPQERKAAVRLTPEEEETAAAGRAVEMVRMISVYAANHQGTLPSDLSALISSDLMDKDRAGEFLKSVIEYRGAEMKNDADANLTVLRYRIPNRTDQELRCLLGGSVYFCKPTDPIAEDERAKEEVEGAGEK